MYTSIYLYFFLFQFHPFLDENANGFVTTLDGEVTKNSSISVDIPEPAAKRSM